MNNQINKLQESIKFDVDRLANMKRVEDVRKGGPPSDEVAMVRFRARTKDGFLLQWFAVRSDITHWNLLTQDTSGRSIVYSLDGTWDSVMRTVTASNNPIIIEVAYCEAVEVQDLEES